MNCNLEIFKIYLNIIKIEAMVEINRNIVPNNLKFLIYKNLGKINIITTLLLYNNMDYLDF